MATYKVLDASGGSSRELQLTEADRLWLCRAVFGERGSANEVVSSKEYPALLWALVNRFLLHPAARRWKADPARGYPTDFCFMLRNFSQPINPRWMAGGDMAIAHSHDESASAARLARRASICAMTLDDMPEGILEYVDDFCAGALPTSPLVLTLRKPRISNWASYKGVEAKYPGGVRIGGNYFFEDKGLRSGHVVVDHWVP